MKQFSSDGSSVELQLITGKLLFVDPLCFDRIKSALSWLKVKSIQEKEDIRLVEEELFPDGDGTLIGFKQVNPLLITYKLDIEKITLYDFDDKQLEKRAANKEITSIAIDSASFLIFDLANFHKAIKAINYDDLVAFLEDESAGYIETINAEIGNKGWAYVVSPGVESGYEFEGDGSYLIN